MSKKQETAEKVEEKAAEARGDRLKLEGGALRQAVQLLPNN